MKILVVEDEAPIRDLISINLQLVGYEVFTAEDGIIAEKFLENQKVDLILLDVMIPGIDGFSLIEKIKKHNTPVIFVTAKESVLDRVKGLRLGAEDYIIKPFSTRELIARINRITLKGDQHLVIKVKDIEFDIDKMVVLKNSVEINLTSLELKILHLLFVNLNKVVKRDEIIERIWEWTGNDVNDNTVTVYLKRIRKKLDTDIIKTIKGIGYRIDVN